MTRLTEEQINAQIDRAIAKQEIINKIEPVAKTVVFDPREKLIVLEFHNRGRFSFSTNSVPFIANLSPEVLATVELTPSGKGLRWDEPDIDLSIIGLILQLSNEIKIPEKVQYNEAEYNALRNEIIHHDRTCFNIISALLISSTAIYGLVANNQNILSLLIVLSLIWFVGFLYIFEKRTTIRRISLYIKEQFEGKQDNYFAWESWSRSNRYPQSTQDMAKITLPKVSPLRLEFILFLITNLVNNIWFWLAIKSIALTIAILATIPSILFIAVGSYLVNQYYVASRKLAQDSNSEERMLLNSTQLS